jgi:hypothetical protein
MAPNSSFTGVQSYIRLFRYFCCKPFGASATVILVYPGFS